jgi:hypothetical protein
VTISVVAVLLVLGLYLVVPIPTGEDWGWEAAIAILCVGALYVMAGVWSMVRITNSKHPMRTGLLSLSVMVTSMVVTFALVYLSMSSRNPESFNVQLDRVSALYFTMTVLSTTGFGDITASTQSAMIAVMIQMVVGLTLLTSLARVLVEAARSATKRRLTDGGHLGT